MANRKYSNKERRASWRQAHSKLPRPSKRGSEEAKFITCVECGYANGRHAKGCIKGV